MSDCADHVWAEFWWEQQRRWVHLDPCEAAYDKPLLYEASCSLSCATIASCNFWSLLLC